MRRSITDRYDQLDAHGDALAGQLTTQPLPIHTATIDVLSELFNMSTALSSGDTPQHLRVMLRMLDKSRPMLLEGIAEVPPAAIRDFLSDLIPKMQAIVDTPDGGPAHAYPAPRAVPAAPAS